MPLFKRRPTKEERIIDKYQTLRARMEMYQEDYASLLELSNHGKGETPAQREFYRRAQRRKKDIDAMLRRIQKLGPLISAAQKTIAGRKLAQARTESESGYRMYGEGVENLHSRNPILQKVGRAQINAAKPMIAPHARAAIAYQHAETQARNARGVSWGTPPNRLKAAWNTLRRRFTRRRAA